MNVDALSRIDIHINYLQFLPGKMQITLDNLSDFLYNFIGYENSSESIQDQAGCTGGRETNV